MVASVRLWPAGPSLMTLPTDTPEIRTSDWLASAIASGKATVSRYPWGFSGDAPPKAIHR
jgi:hypothetical protein